MPGAALQVPQVPGSPVLVPGSRGRSAGGPHVRTQPPLAATWGSISPLPLTGSCRSRGRAERPQRATLATPAHFPTNASPIQRRGPCGESAMCMRRPARCPPRLSRSDGASRPPEIAVVEYHAALRRTSRLPLAARRQPPSRAPGGPQAQPCGRKAGCARPAESLSRHSTEAWRRAAFPSNSQAPFWRMSDTQAKLLQMKGRWRALA